MKIMICGSMGFAKEMLELQNKLEAFGHAVLVPCDTELHIEKPDLIDDLEKDLEHVIENDVLRQCFDLLASSDAVVFLNLPKNGIEGYIGTSALMEMGLAFYLGKRIYLMHAFPDPSEQRWAHEVASIRPVILNGSVEMFRTVQAIEK